MSAILGYHVVDGRGTQFLILRPDSAKAWADSGCAVTPLVAAPVEDGRPTYVDLTRSLAALLSTVRAHAANYATEEQLDVTCRHAAALLSRIPKEDR